jgi:hypothetical protein
MILDKQGTTTIVSQEDIDIQAFIANLNAKLEDLAHDNLVVKLFYFEDLTVGQVLEFQPLSDNHRGKKRSFVLVTDKVSYDDLPESICVVPTLQEAMDFIEMEEIERDLGF